MIKNKYAEAAKGITQELLTMDNDSWYNYAINLPEDTKATYMIVLLHQQVFNGGFHQYFSNGYGQFAKETIEVLNKIGATTSARLLKEAFKWFENDSVTHKEFRHNLLNGQMRTLFDDDEFCTAMDKLDNYYYEAEHEDLEQLLGEYLTKKR